MPLSDHEKERARAWTETLRAAAAQSAPDAFISMRFMFGGAGFYAATPQGESVMFAGWFGGETFALKVPPDVRDQLIALGGGPIGTPEEWRALYAEVPPGMDDDADALAPFVGESIAFSLARKARPRRR